MSSPRAHLEALSAVAPRRAAAIRPALPDMGDEVIAAIRAGVPQYARPLEGSFGRGVRAGVGEALRRFVEDIERPGADPGGWRDVYFNLGAGEVRQGRTLDALLAAYRVGARVAWRRVAEAARADGAGADELAALAEAIFAYIDEISAISAEGYAQQQAAAAGERQRRREALVGLLIEGPGPEALERAAAAAAWQVPGSAAAVVVRDAEPAALASRLGQGVIAAPVPGGLVCAVVPDAGSPGRIREVAAGLGDLRAGAGPTVEPAAIGLSFERARGALALLEAGLLSESPALAVDHLADLVVHGDPQLLREHAGRELAGLGELTPAARERMVATLRAWVEHPGRPTEVARALGLHPQTARYRLRRLRELIGDIDDPERRFELALALRAR